MNFTQRRLLLSAIGCLPVAVSVIAPMAAAAPITASPKAGKRGRRVGIAFGGGSLHGIAHVGVLKALAEQGLGGPVSLSDVGGRAEFITFSLSGSESWNPLTWWGALRSGRAWDSLRPRIETTQIESSAGKQ